MAIDAPGCLLPRLGWAGFRIRRRAGESRTHTVADLNRVPLPLGYGPSVASKPRRCVIASGVRNGTGLEPATDRPWGPQRIGADRAQAGTPRAGLRLLRKPELVEKPGHMPGRLDVVERVLDPAVGADDERGTNDAHHRLAVIGFLPVGAVRNKRVLVDI